MVLFSILSPCIRALCNFLAESIRPLLRLLLRMILVLRQKSEHQQCVLLFCAVGLHCHSHHCSSLSLIRNGLISVLQRPGPPPGRLGACRGLITATGTADPSPMVSAGESAFKLVPLGRNYGSAA